MLLLKLIGYRVYSIRFDKNCIRFVFLVIMILFSLRAPLFAEQLLTFDRVAADELCTGVVGF